MLMRRDRAMVAVTIMLDIAFHAGRSGTVSASDLAERLGLARRGMEPLLQALSRAELLDSVRGPRGGYRLGRPRRDITVAEIVAVAVAIGNSDPAEGNDGPVGDLQTKVIDAVWDELDRAARVALEAQSLEDLIKRAAAAGLRRASDEPISFAI